MKLSERSHRQNVLFTPGTRNTMEFYREFARLYNTLKHEGLRPNQIRTELTRFIDCSYTSHARYLRTCRSLGLITDSYPENLAARKPKLSPVEQAVREKIAREIASVPPPKKPTPSGSRVVTEPTLSDTISSLVSTFTTRMRRAVAKLKYKE